MPSHNSYPTSPERKTFVHQETVQFTDGETALGFRTKGDKLVLGHGSTHKYARNFDIDDMAWIKTKSGNRYGIAQGLVVNQGRQTAGVLPYEDLQVTIGEPLVIPGIGITTDVESVLLRYKWTTPGTVPQQVGAPSPFTTLQAQVEAVHAANPNLGQ